MVSHSNTLDHHHPSSFTQSPLAQASHKEPGGHGVLLHNISWQQYEDLLTVLGDRPSTRIAYDDGTLEIMTPLPEHGYFKQTIGLAVNDIADELEMDYDSYGSTTWKSELKKAGVEPDDCFYIQNEPLIRGKLTFDLIVDPPPDFVIEIDVTSKSLERFSIYARLGVPEIGRYGDGLLSIHLLDGEHYFKSPTSLAFPKLPVQELPQIISEYRPKGKRAMRRAFRQWARQHGA
ncbi:MAG: Uma2 family endonuclease [Merismopedia sp. SIO2A8]|nr:Uma2 family endonuclease [Merismopedia sp. SIO2A8]